MIANRYNSVLNNNAALQSAGMQAGAAGQAGMMGMIGSGAGRGDWYCRYRNRYLMHDLISETCRKVEQWLGQCANPCVLWSGGKDSTAMLHLIRHEVGAKLPCVQWREPRFRSRYAHSDRLAAEWDLEVYDWTPLAYALTDGYDIETGQPRFDFVKCYEMAPRKVMFLCLGTEEPKAEELASGRYLCGLDALRRPTGTFNFPWDGAFHGQKSADVDLDQRPSAARRGRLGAGRCADAVLSDAPLERCGCVGLPRSGRRAQ
jgi:hypothetical protein